MLLILNDSWRVPQSMQWKGTENRGIMGKQDKLKEFPSFQVQKSLYIAKKKLDKTSNFHVFIE